MKPRAAEIFSDQSSASQRSAVRRSLRLPTPAYNFEHVTVATVLNMSETGILIETGLDLQVHETLSIDIPEASGTVARVVWKNGLLAGCEFIEMLPTSAVSAAQLKSPINSAQPGLNAAPAEGGTPIERSYGASSEGSAETAVVIFTLIIALLAVLILVAAIFDFTGLGGLAASR